MSQNIQDSEQNVSTVFGSASGMSHLSSVDKAKHQSSNFSGKNQHDDHKELRRGDRREKIRGQKQRHGGIQVWRSRHTYKTQADFGLPDGGAAPHQAKNEHHRTDADDDRRGDQSVPVLDEAVKVVIAPDHVGADIGHRRPCSLQGG